MRFYHEFGPVFDSSSKILILGSFPSVKSREEQFYYMHPQNRFWPLLASLLGCETPAKIEDKKAMLLENNIALWDVIASCEIVGSSDTSITNPKLCQVNSILQKAAIRAIFTNGKKAYSLYNKYQKPITGMEAGYLPSTSPANAAFSFDNLKEEWKVICKYL